MHKKTHRTDKPDGKPVLCQRTFSSVFRAVFYTQFNLGCMGPFRVYGALETHLVALSMNRFSKRKRRKFTVTVS